MPPPAAGRGRGAAAANAAPAGPPARSTWYAEPAKVADNLYFLGTRIHNAWALVGSEGIIVFEALFDYAAPDEIADGMRKVGLDVNRGQARRHLARARRLRRGREGSFRTRCRRHSVQMVTTPGHTAGTPSFLFELKDNGNASVRKMAKSAVDRYFTLVEECTTAAKLRAAPKQ